MFCSLSIPERNSLSFEYPHLMGVSGDQWRLAEELLLRDGPEVASWQVLGRGAGLQVILSVQPPQPQQLAVTVERVPPKGQCKSGGRKDARCGQDLVVQRKVPVKFGWNCLNSGLCQRSLWLKLSKYLRSLEKWVWRQLLEFIRCDVQPVQLLE